MRAFTCFRKIMPKLELGIHRRKLKKSKPPSDPLMFPFLTLNFQLSTTIYKCYAVIWYKTQAYPLSSTSGYRYSVNLAGNNSL